MPGRLQGSLRIGLWCGVAAPLLYVATVVTGGAAVDGYSHIRDGISSLTESGRSGAQWIGMAFFGYNLLIAAFAIAALSTVRPLRSWTIVFGLLLVTAVCGVLMWPLAMDPIGAPATITGIVHIVLAAITSLATIAILVLSAFLWWRSGRAGLAALGVGCLALTLPFGLIAAIAAAGGWPTMGLFERVTIGGFEIWVLVAALSLLLSGPSLEVARRGQ